MVWEPDLSIINEKPFYVKYVGLSNRKTLLWIDIAGTTYVYSRQPGNDPIKEIARKFQKMLSYGKSGGRALAWLKKNTEYTGTKMPTDQAKSQVEDVMTAEQLIDEFLGEAWKEGDIVKVALDARKPKEQVKAKILALYGGRVKLEVLSGPAKGKEVAMGVEFIEK